MTSSHVFFQPNGDLLRTHTPPLSRLIRALSYSLPMSLAEHVEIVRNTCEILPRRGLLPAPIPDQALHKITKIDTRRLSEEEKNKQEKDHEKREKEKKMKKEEIKLMKEKEEKNKTKKLEEEREEKRKEEKRQDEGKVINNKHDSNEAEDDCPSGAFKSISTGKCRTDVTTPQTLNIAYGIDSNSGGRPDASQGILSMIDDNVSPQDLVTFSERFDIPSNPILHLEGGHADSSLCFSNRFLL